MHQALTSGLALVALASFAGEPGRRDWPQGRRDARGTAAVELDVEASPRPWTFSGSGRVYGYEPGMTVWSSPAIARVGDRALLVVGSYDHDVYALDAATGERVWKFATGGPVYSTPAIGSAGAVPLVFAASSDRLVYALDAATGRQVWVHAVEEFRATLGGARLSAPCLGTSNGRDAVFVGRWVWDRSLGHPEQQGGLTALYAADGKPAWKTELGDNEVGPAVFARVGGAGRLFAGSSNGNLYSLDADTGRLLWTRTELDAIRSAPAVFETADGPRVVYGSKYGLVRCLDAATGAELWAYKTGDRVMGGPAVVGDGPGQRVVVGSYDRTLYALDASTGRPVWKYSARGGIYSSPAVAAEGKATTVLVSAWDHALHAVDADTGAPRFTVFTGRPLWDVSGLDQSAWASPVAAKLGGQWMVFVGGYDGTLRAFPLEAASPSSRLARSDAWFWASFPLSLVAVAALARFLTVRSRARPDER